MSQFLPVVTVKASRDRLYHPEMYRKGDSVTVGLVRGMTGRWLVRTQNAAGERVNGIVNRSYRNYAYARKVAREFAASL